MFVRFAVAAALPVLAVIAAIHPASAEYASISLPVDQVLQSLKGQTNLPIFIPEDVQIAAEESVYWRTNASPNSYAIEFQFTPDCRGATYCYIGSFSAERGGQFGTKDGAKVYEGVILRGGLKALHTQYCGVVCQSNLEWKLGGVLYRVNFKNGVYESLVNTANSAIVGGQR